MTVDLLGPASLNSVTVRPARTNTRGASDTWFQDCSTSTSNDGTTFSADYFNDALAQLRTAIADAGIVQDNGDDMLWRVFEIMGVRYAADTGTTNALVISNTPPQPAYRAGMLFGVNVAHANTGPATINVDGLGTKAIVTSAGNVLAGGELTAGVVEPLMYDGTSFRILQAIAAGPIALGAPKTYYIDASIGSDSYDGLAATVGSGHGPFLTLQHALNQIQQWNLNGNNLTIQLAAGTYSSSSPASAPTANGAGNVLIQGVTSSPSSVVIECTSGSALIISATSAAPYSLNNLTFSAPNDNVITGDPGNALTCLSGTTILRAINFDAAYQCHLVSANVGTTVSIYGPIVIGGGAFFHLAAEAGAEIGFADPTTSPAWAGPTLSVATAVTFSVETVLATSLAQIQGYYYGGTTGGSNVTGQRYSVTGNAVINANGGGSGAFPGSSAGTTATGGQYLP